MIKNRGARTYIVCAQAFYKGVDKMIKITASIEGMMCGMCEAHMNDAIRAEFKVKKVTSSHADKQTVIICEDNIDEAKLKAVVEKTGYKLLEVKSESYKKKGFSLFGR